MATRKELDALLEEANKELRRLDRPEMVFYITRPGDREGTRYQLKRADTWSDLSWVMNSREMERVLRTSNTIISGIGHGGELVE